MYTPLALSGKYLIGLALFRHHASAVVTLHTVHTRQLQRECAGALVAVSLFLSQFRV